MQPEADAAGGIGRALVKAMVLLVLGVLSAAIVCPMPSAYAEGGDGVSPGEFDRYQRRQELELEREQAVRARLSAPRSVEEARRQRRRFETERLHQRQLLERQRRWVAGERARSRPLPRSGTSREFIQQRLRREQASERLSRKLAR
ncbi:MAG TPA: hypothetical protein VLS27_00960 [Gammaproteobacteria bacterium]|nr:hypothetical protein [Gammaproteobacteria bacterium]